jgi:gamma-glutamylcyclotransferase (GGCT)/AIG2-like uncharacterized protein YtfP
MSTPSPGTTAYFAYGSNMCRQQMAQRCPGAQIQGRASLVGHRFIINSRGWASIVPQPQSIVHGVIWHLTDRHIKTLDHYEDVALDLYRKLTVTLASECGTQSFAAMTYISTHTDHGSPQKPYIKGILNAAQNLCLPPDYLVELQSWV